MFVPQGKYDDHVHDLIYVFPGKYDDHVRDFRCPFMENTTIIFVNLDVRSWKIRRLYS